MNDIKQQVMGKIKSGEIKPTSRWYFMSRDYFFWTLTTLSVVFGSLATASVLHQVVTSHIRPLRDANIDAGYVKLFLETLPYLWLLLFAALVAAAWFNFKNTARSYRHHNSLVVALVVVASFACGLVLFVTGLGQTIDDSARARLPFYAERIEKRELRRDEFYQNRFPDRNARPGRPQRSKPPRVQVN